MVRNLRTPTMEWKCFIEHVKPLKGLLRAHGCNANMPDGNQRPDDGG